MLYEAAQKEYYAFVESKLHLEKALFRLSDIKNTEHICLQLESAYRLIEGMQQLKKIKKYQIET